ncbi:MAG TPA: hypothetical protein VLK84_07530 [Longimicrobium sp.]|nr:hypothetical protein [Longimicrobium sp.]
MTISEYVCELCEYRYEGCGGLGVLMSGDGRQTVSCAACQALHDVPLGISLWSAPNAIGRRRSRRAPEPVPLPIEERVTELTFACPVDPSHPVRPWTDGDPGRRAVPGALSGVCPRCDCRMQFVRTVMEAD